MPPDDWATRHPELVHWLQQAEDELVGYAPIDDIPIPTAVFPERCSRFLSSSAPHGAARVAAPPVGLHGLSL